jgi:hypothetical protein
MSLALWQRGKARGRRMKAWELINSLKGTTASKEQIANWSLMNKVCPVEFETELDLDCEYPAQLRAAARKACDRNKCDDECLEMFLGADVTDGGGGDGRR